eukprot:1388283-Amorphochlora_amoeboformis.AAC.1
MKRTNRNLWSIESRRLSKKLLKSVARACEEMLHHIKSKKAVDISRKARKPTLPKTDLYAASVSRTEVQIESQFWEG